MDNKKDSHCGGGSERRCSARSRLFTLVTVRGRGNQDKLWAWDIGLGGMKARSRKARFPGTFLDLEFRLPDSKEILRVGAQVTDMEATDDGSVGLGLRFCRVSPMVQMAIYRFMDRRRRLWEPAPRAKAELAGETVQEERPFEGLLSHAFDTLRAKECQLPSSSYLGPSAELARLSQVLGPSR